jgi:hypothetical protein
VRAKALPGSFQTYFELQDYLSIVAVLLLLLQVGVRRWPATRKVGHP